MIARFLPKLLVTAVLFVTVASSRAQIAFDQIQWNYQTNPGFRMQLEQEGTMRSTYWADIQSGVELNYNYCKYIFNGDHSNYSNGTHLFTIGSNSLAKRSEMKIEFQNYETNGIYQMEGEVRFIQNKNSPSHVCQIWQNMVSTGNKILIYNTQTANGGTLFVPSSSERVGTFSPLTNIYSSYNNSNNQWLKVNVVHFRATRKVYIYLNNVLYNEYTHGVADGEYYFKFGAYGKLSGTSNQEAQVEWRNMKFFVGQSVPAAPTGLSVSAVSSSQIDVSWNDNSNNETNFVVERSLTTDFSNPGYTRTFAANTTGFSNTNLVANRTYYYRVKAINANGSSAYSSIVSATTWPGYDYLTLEAESGSRTSPMQVVNDATASGGQYVVTNGSNSTTSAPTTGHVVLNFTTSSSGAFKIWARTLFPNGGDNSFWVKIDNGSWFAWNDDAAVSTSWKWNLVTTPTLSAGAHTLTFAYREDGSRLDRIAISNDPAYDPVIALNNSASNPLLSMSAPALNDWNGTNDNRQWNQLKGTKKNELFVVGNRSSIQLQYRIVETSNTHISVLDGNGRLIRQSPVEQNQTPGSYQRSIIVGYLPTGIYYVRLQTGREWITKKVFIP